MFSYLVLPFGLCNTHYMEIYMDDFTIYGVTFEEEKANLETILKYVKTIAIL